MINQDSKIIVNDISKKIETSRSKLMSENPSFKKPLIFKGYKTEKDRIQQNITNNRFLHDYQDQCKEKNNQDIKKNSLSLSPISKNNFNKNSSLKRLQTKNKSIIQMPSLKNKYNNKEEIKLYHLISPIKKGGKSLSIKEGNKIDNNVKKGILLQPQMKFKEKTDLERIYDDLNEKYPRANKKMIVEKQIKSEDVLNFKSSEDFIKDKLNFSDCDIFQKEYKDNTFIFKNKNKYIKNNNKTKRSSIGKYYYNPRNNKYYQKALKYRHNLNGEVGSMMKSYHYKIHFKAAEEIAENQTKKKNSKKSHLFLLPNLFMQKNDSKINTEKNFSFEDKEFYKEENEEKNSEEISYDSFYYKNPLKKITKNNPELMREISKIARIEKEKEIQKENRIYNEHNKKINLIPNLNEENEIEIDGKTYNIVNQFNLIANKILKLCNVYKNKSLHNNINLKAGSGKTMITQGMSINDFEKKYGFKKGK